jgi:hypothetical protein
LYNGRLEQAREAHGKAIELKLDYAAYLLFEKYQNKVEHIT